MIPAPKTLKEGTDCYRLFVALRSGEPKSHQELYALHMIVHSRASDLRLKHGCLIDTWRDGNSTFYQLRAVQSPEASLTDVAVSGARASGPPQPTSAGGPSPLLSAEAGALRAEAEPGSPQKDPGQVQLLIWEAA